MMVQRSPRRRRQLVTLGYERWIPHCPDQLARADLSDIFCLSRNCPSHTWRSQRRLSGYSRLTVRLDHSGLLRWSHQPRQVALKNQLATNLLRMTAGIGAAANNAHVIK